MWERAAIYGRTAGTMRHIQRAPKATQRDQLSWRNPECRGCRKFQAYSCSLLDSVPGLGNPSSCPHTVEICWLPGKWGRWRRDPFIYRKGTVGMKFSTGHYRAVGASYPQSC